MWELLILRLYPHQIHKGGLNDNGETIMAIVMGWFIFLRTSDTVHKHSAAGIKTRNFEATILIAD